MVTRQKIQRVRDCVASWDTYEGDKDFLALCDLAEAALDAREALEWELLGARAMCDLWETAEPKPAPGSSGLPEWQKVRDSLAALLSHLPSAGLSQEEAEP